jgi:hypothetical protein
MVCAGGLYSLQKLLCAALFQKVNITDDLKQFLLPPSLGQKNDKYIVGSIVHYYNRHFRTVISQSRANIDVTLHNPGSSPIPAMP